MSPEKRFTQAQKDAIVAAIRQAEKDTSGEIRVHIETRCKNDVLDRATEVFAELKMHKTELRNGTLIYLALDDHKLAILGDAGINSKVNDDFWNKTKDIMIAEFRQGQISEGICKGIINVGHQLKQFFPCQEDDVNELPDDISFSKEEGAK